MKDKWKKYKKTDEFRVEAPKSVQDIIEIKSISDNGIFEIGKGGIYTKVYKFTDINFYNLSENEKSVKRKSWCDWLNSRHEIFSITFNNKNVDKKRVNDEVLFEYKADGLDDIRDSYNDVELKRKCI